MKKLLLFFSMLLLATHIMASDEAHIALAKVVAEGNRQCPLYMGIMGDITSITYDGVKKVRIVFSVNDQAYDVENIKNNRDLTLRTFKLTFNNKDGRMFLDYLANADAELNFVFQNKDSEAKVELNLTNADIKEILAKPLSEEEQKQLLLASQVNMENARCPYSIGDGMNLISVKDDGSFIVYTCTVNENKYAIGQVEAVKAQVKESVKTMFSDPIMNREIHLMADLGRGMIYRYKWSKSGETVDIVFTAEELAETPVLDE